jgi:hypothetical protein
MKNFINSLLFPDFIKRLEERMLRKDLALWLPHAFTYIYHCCLIMVVQIIIAGIVSPSWQGSDLYNGLIAAIVIFIASFAFSKLSQLISLNAIGGLALKLNLYSQLKLWLFSNFMCVFKQHPD